MRMLMKLSIPVEAGNAAIKDGSLPKVLQGLLDAVKPEAAYFYGENGRRAAVVIFDMQSPSQIPPICEPAFQGMNAAVELFPVMNLDDLKAGLQTLMSGS
jgi:hypothetical protein